jgi:hypothetical protein
MITSPFWCRPALLLLPCVTPHTLSTQHTHAVNTAHTRCQHSTQTIHSGVTQPQSEDL